MEVVNSENQTSADGNVRPGQTPPHPRDIGHFLKLLTHLRTAEAMREAITDRWVPSESGMSHSDYAKVTDGHFDIII